MAKEQEKKLNEKIEQMKAKNVTIDAARLKAWHNEQDEKQGRQSWCA